VIEHALEAAGPVVVWIADTAVSAVAGLALGMVVVGIVLGIGRLRGTQH
jgi:predicted DNA repair protein MutK